MALRMFRRRSLERFRINNSYLFGCVIRKCERNFSNDDSKKHNLYGTLGLNSSATQSEIKKAYYDLTFKYHPDRNEGSTEAATKFREVTEAYEVLGNYGLRKRYDKGMPMPHDTKQSVPRKYKEVSVKYQKFFDSRATQQNANLRYDEINQNVNAQRTSENQKNVEWKNESDETSGSVQMVIVVFICLLLLVSKIS